MKDEREEFGKRKRGRIRIRTRISEGVSKG